MREYESVIQVKKFSVQRVFVVAKRVTKQIFRDRRTFGLMVIAPFIVMFIFGAALSGDLKNIPIVVDNQDSGYNIHEFNPQLPSVQLDFGDKMVSSLKNDSRLIYNEGSYESTKEKVDKGKYYAVILIPENFSQNIFLKSQGVNTTIEIFLYIDGTKPTIKNTIILAVQEALQNAVGENIVTFHQEYAHGGVEFSGLDTSLPGVIGYVLTFFVTLVSSLTIVRDRLGGTTERMYSTPLRSSEKLIGYILALELVGLLYTVIILGIGIGVFGVAVRGSIVLLLIIASLYSLLHVLIAISYSNFAENELQAFQIAPIIALPSLAISGMLIPVESLPELIQPFAYITPLFYGIRLMEGIMLKDWGMNLLWKDFLVLIGMSVLFLVFSLLTVRDKIRA